MTSIRTLPPWWWVLYAVMVVLNIAIWVVVGSWFNLSVAIFMALCYLWLLYRKLTSSRIRP